MPRKTSARRKLAFSCGLLLAGATLLRTSATAANFAASSRIRRPSSRQERSRHPAVALRAAEEDWSQTHEDHRYSEPEDWSLTKSDRSGTEELTWHPDHDLSERALNQMDYGPSEIGDMLIPPQPIGRLVQKGADMVAVEYDPNIHPEFVKDTYGRGGEFVWEPLTPEGGIISEDGYDELAFPVPADRVDYIQGAGYLQAAEGEDYRAYLSERTEVRDGREWHTVILKGGADSVAAGAARLMDGLLHRRPWEVNFHGS
mmetsp:Transcript_19680/g.45914  ORF Transcript_19680/g.45914 Transcript_19680/m.45914 type:complete len:258 (-) Transcript_19680:37-810(-)